MSPRYVLVLILALAHGSVAPAQSVNLTETPVPGDCSRSTIELKLTGQLVLAQDRGKEQLRLEAKARQRFTERTLTVADGLPLRSARFYDEAGVATLIAGEKVQRNLPADRRLIVTDRGREGLVCFSPAGPLTRDELDLVTEHFNPQCVAGLLPGKEVNAGDTWTVRDAAAHSASLLDSLIRNGLTGKLTGVIGGLASFTIEGSLEGIENGGKVTIAVKASGKYDITQRRVVELTWTQTDEREPGPVNPASKVEAVVELKREMLQTVPRELADDALRTVPPGERPAATLLLRHDDPKGRYRFVYARDWHITGESDPHLVLRLLDQGAFAVQATLTAWQKADPGKHATVDEFKKAIANTPEWVPDRVLDDGEVPLNDGRWLYRLSVAGRLGGVPVVQRFHLLAGAQGDQVVITITLPPEKGQALGTRDLELVRTIEFGRTVPK